MAVSARMDMPEGYPSLKGHAAQGGNFMDPCGNAHGWPGPAPDSE
jgi:hypothetical protein